MSAREIQLFSNLFSTTRTETPERHVFRMVARFFRRIMSVWDTSVEFPSSEYPQESKILPFPHVQTTDRASVGKLII